MWGRPVLAGRQEALRAPEAASQEGRSACSELLIACLPCPPALGRPPKRRGLASSRSSCLACGATSRAGGWVGWQGCMHARRQPAPRCAGRCGNPSPLPPARLAGGASCRRPWSLAPLMPVSDCTAWWEHAVRQQGGAERPALHRLTPPPLRLNSSTAPAVWDACSLGANGLVFFWSGAACINFLIRCACMPLQALARALEPSADAAPLRMPPRRLPGATARPLLCAPATPRMRAGAVASWPAPPGAGPPSHLSTLPWCSSAPAATRSSTPPRSRG